MKVRGRPKKDIVRSIKCDIRISEKEREMLGYMCYKTDLSRSDVIREAIRRYYNFLKYVE